jgi:hypothetical protein
MAYNSDEFVQKPLLEVPSRGSFYDTSSKIADDMLAQNIVLSLDRAIKWETRTKHDEKAMKYK